jgi:hypothetical protein
MSVTSVILDHVSSFESGFNGLFSRILNLASFGRYGLRPFRSGEKIKPKRKDVKRRGGGFGIACSMAQAVQDG